MRLTFSLGYTAFAAVLCMVSCPARAEFLGCVTVTSPSTAGSTILFSVDNGFASHPLIAAPPADTGTRVAGGMNAVGAIPTLQIVVNAPALSVLGLSPMATPAAPARTSAVAITGGFFAGLIANGKADPGGDGTFAARSLDLAFLA